MSHFVYIIYSEKIDQYYIGESKNVEERVNQHNKHLIEKSFTTRASDWQLIKCFECENIEHARRFEKFIKRMKSRKFIQSLIDDKIKVDDIIQKCR
jgi:putative endonuclease